MKKKDDYTAIVTVKRSGFTYAYAFMSESSAAAKKFVECKFDLQTTEVKFKKGAYTISNGKVVPVILELDVE